MLAATEREVCAVGAAGTGKSRGWLERLHRDALTYPGSRQLILRQTRTSLTQAAMTTLETEVIPPGQFGLASSDRPIRFHSERQEYLYPGGSVIGVVGLDDPGKVYSTQWDRIYCQEVNQIPRRAYTTLLRALRNNVLPHQQIVSDMNPQVEQHWMHQRCDAGTTREILTSHADNPALTAEYLAGLATLEGAERDSLYLGLRIIEVEGAFYGGEIRRLREEGRVRRVLYDPAAVVYVAFDLGIDDYTALWWFQLVGSEWHWLRYHEENGQGLDHYAKLIRQVGDAADYDYGALILPHDGAAREIGTGLTRQEQLAGKGYRVLIAPRLGEGDQIAAGRRALATSYFDQEGAKYGLQRLASYKKAIDPASGQFLERAVHDDASHGAKAFATAVTGPRVVKKRREQVYEPKAWHL